MLILLKFIKLNARAGLEEWNKRVNFPRMLSFPYKFPQHQ